MIILITLYSTGCPRCNVLKQKLDSKNNEYTVVNDVDIMTEKGFETVPVLEVDGQIMMFADAIKWIDGRDK